ncbi:MAG: DUF1549 domain-containing protein [Pirellulaceae bacterium]
MPCCTCLVRTSRLAAALAVAISTPLFAEIIVMPRQIVLRGPEAAQQLIVQRVTDGLIGEQLREGVEWVVNRPDVVSVTNGYALPQANGTARLTVRAGSESVSVDVTVEKMDEPFAWSFRHHVQAVLSKASCNSGACHGALAGKGGFKLSLRGYDPAKDYLATTRQANGRRIELADPGRSLLLAKPAGALPHRGGLRFETDSLDYRILAEWIRDGAPGPRPADPQLQRITVEPQSSHQRIGNHQQVVVQAHYSDGRIDDVTRWAKFTSANETVASVDDRGEVTITGHGVGAVTAWFASKIVIAELTVPYENAVSSESFAAEPRRNFIDELVLEQLERMKVRPSPLASDSEFLRRAYLDTIGTLPTIQETREFLADSQADKRDQLIERLLARSEFVDYWAYKWSDVLAITGDRLRPAAVKAYYQWVRAKVAANQPWDAFVREIVTAQGSSTEQGATNFYALHQDPETMSENVSQAFLGLSINCARCHNHPLEKWTNDQYYAMANLFARVRAKGWGGDARSGDGQRTLVVADKGDLVQPATGKPQPPAPLDAPPVPFDDPADRRVYLAKWLTAPENPYFARSITNRIWANFFGVGLVEPVDDMRVSNPASNEQLLSAAAQFLVEHDFDLKALMRAILHSSTYQRSSQPLPENEADTRFYSRYYPKRQMAEVLLDSISQVTGVPSEFTEVAYSGSDRQKTDFYPRGTRALQLYDAAVRSYFLRTFGRNQRMITCECERSDEPSMVQVLHLSNGDTINEKLQAKEGRVAQLLQSGTPHYAIIEEVYLAALSRYPTDGEMVHLLQILAASPPEERRQLVEDIFWSVLSSREFLFHH